MKVDRNRIVNVAAAERRPPLSAIISVNADSPIPGFSGDGWEEAATEFYRAEGRRLAECLIETLPGGTLSQLLVALLDHRADLLRVPPFVPRKPAEV